MQKRKRSKKRTKIFEAYLILICISIFFICIGYAETSNDLLEIDGTVSAETQQGVFITNITNLDETSTNSKINYILGTMFEGHIELNNDISDSEIFEVTIFNNSEIPHVFIDTLTDIEKTELYDNKNIEYYVAGIEKYETIINPQQSLTFTIAFKYKNDANISNNLLNCKLNFRFKEMPQLVLSNDNQTYTITDVYPDYTPQRYEFWVKNYNGEFVNTVPLTYSFNIEIEKPLTAKIYDKNNNEVIGNINLGSSQKEDQQYFLEIIWDNTNTEENIKYDSAEYENKEFHCKVQLNANTNDEKYLDYTIHKEFNVNIHSNDYKDTYTITYTDIENVANYPTEITQGENLVINFKEVPVELQVNGSDDFIYNKPTLTINNVQSDIEIINTTGVLIAFEKLEDTVFSGNNYIDTGVLLFDEANIDRNFIISFEIKADDQNQSHYGTILSAMDERGAPYPGFIFRIADTNRISEYELTANTVSGKGKAYYNPRETTTKIQIARIDGILYAKVNDGHYEVMQDYNGFTNYFDFPVTFGSGLNASKKPFRYFKGTLSNMTIKFLYDKAADIILITNDTAVNETNEEVNQEQDDSTADELNTQLNSNLNIDNNESNEELNTNTINTESNSELQQYNLETLGT